MINIGPRLNSTHVFLGGGFAQAYTVKDPLLSRKKAQDKPSVDIVSGGGVVPRSGTDVMIF
jgi:hypothetical protein